VTTYTTTIPPGIRIPDLPDLGPVTDATSLVGDLAGSGRFTGRSLKTYVGATGPINVKEPPYSAVGNGVADDTTALQAAFDAGASSGRNVYMPVGTYKVTNTLTIGNGSAAAFSTKAGIVIRGAIPPPFPWEILGVQWQPILQAVPCTRIVWAGAVAGNKAVIDVLGPLCSWGLENIYIEGSNGADWGLRIMSAMRGECSGLTIANCLQWQILSSCWATSPSGALANSMHNNFRSTILSISYNRNFGGGIRLDGLGSGNSCYCNFYDLFISMACAVGLTSVYGIYLAACDSNEFFNVHLTNGNPGNGIGVLCDYTGFSADWPAGNTIWGIDWAGLTTAMTSAGTPGGSAKPNTIAALNQCNGGEFPNSSNVNMSVVGGVVAQKALSPLTAGVASTPLYAMAPPAQGALYALDYYMYTTGATSANAGSTLTFWAVWPDGVGTATQSSSALNAGPTGGNNVHGSITMLARGPISFSVVLAGLTTGTPNYGLVIALRRIY
jgi:hypothetical protein